MRRDAQSGTPRTASHLRNVANRGSHTASRDEDSNSTSASPRGLAGRGRDRPGDEGRGGGSGAGSGGGAGGAGVSYAQRVARLRKPALAAADKTALDPEERQRIAEQLRVRKWQRLGLRGHALQKKRID